MHVFHCQYTWFDIGSFTKETSLQEMSIDDVINLAACDFSVVTNCKSKKLFFKREVSDLNFKQG